MAQEGQEPAWLASLREQQQAQQPSAPQAQAPPGRESQMGREDVAGGPSGPLGPEDVMEGLREQMIQAGVAYEREERSSLAQVFVGLEPWQRLILAVLLFLDVALCGCMALVMAGRVMLPF